MRVFYGNKGLEYYIMCTDFKEIRVFDMFGNLSDVTGTIDSCNNWLEVDFLSFISTGVNSCELLFNGYKVELYNSLFKELKPYKIHGKYLGTMFSILHEDGTEGRFLQVILVYKKGVISSKKVNEQYPNRYWRRLINP